jgi:outer membrane protein OmpA-like peptidoglycan-associated protein
MMPENRTFLILVGCFLYLSCFSQTNRDTSINFYFAINSAQLDSNQYQLLKDFSSAFQIKAIKGYADTTGAQGYNISLSKKRAYSVYAALSNIASADKIKLLFLGESAEESELGRNRKVKVIASLIPKKKVADPIILKAGDSITLNEPASETSKHAPVVVRTFDLKYIYFIPDQAIVTYESLPYIQELADILKTYKTESFEIIGHINYQSRFDSTHLRDLYQLSERRAKAVYDLLVKQGIPASRMSYKGVGNSQPVYPKPVNDEQRLRNMRVQIIIKE